MEDQGSSRRLSAVLIADIAGYTKLVEQDTEGTVSELKSVRSSVINPAISRLNGRIVKTYWRWVFSGIPVGTGRCRLCYRNADRPPDKFA